MGMYDCQWKVYRALLYAHIRRNATKLTGRRFTVQMCHGPKHAAKTTEDFLKAKKKKYYSVARPVT